MIVGHHGGEGTLLQAAVVAAGSLSLVLALFRFELSRLGRRFRRGPGNRDQDIRGDARRQERLRRAARRDG
jgi:hypothetical protein